MTNTQNMVLEPAVVISIPYFFKNKPLYLYLSLKLRQFKAKFGTRRNFVRHSLRTEISYLIFLCL